MCVVMSFRWADCAQGPYVHDGLTELGEQIVLEMNKCEPSLSLSLYLSSTGVWMCAHMM